MRFATRTSSHPGHRIRYEMTWPWKQKRRPSLWLWKPKAVFPTSRPLENAPNWMTRSYMSFLKNPTREPKQGTIKGQNPLKTTIHLHCLIPPKWVIYPSSSWSSGKWPKFVGNHHFPGAPISIPPWSAPRRRTAVMLQSSWSQTKSSSDRSVGNTWGWHPVYPNWKYPT